MDEEGSNTPKELSRVNSPATGNPGTPRGDQEVRATPPLAMRQMPQQLNPQQIQQLQQQHLQQLAQSQHLLSQQPAQSKYSQLLAVIEDMGRDIRPTYAGSKTSAERLKRGIVHSRILVRECLMECERSARTYCMATTLQVIDTGYSADSVEWCPLDGLQDVMLCGTYQLQETLQNDAVEEHSKQSQTRVGKLHLYCLEGEPESMKLRHVSSVDMPGILDIKWCSIPIDGQAIFGLVNSVGELHIYKLNSKNIEDGIIPLSLTSVGHSLLGLSLDWSNKVCKSSSPSITCSSSDGRITTYQLTDSGLSELLSWKAHDFEAWITAFNYWNENIVYSGGDDCKFKGWDIRQSPELPVFISKRHSMGVCSVQSCHLKPNLLCTGSYDENLFIWDDRNMKMPLAETSLGGGVWRVKWEPHSADLILTATMYNGFHVLDARDISCDSLPILCHYKEHSSIAYGADWCFKDSHQKSVSSGNSDLVHSHSIDSSNIDSTDTCRTIATCSFYDHCLHLWNYKEVIS